MCDPGELEPLVQQRELALQLGEERVEGVGVDLRRVAVRDRRDADQGLQLARTSRGPSWRVPVSVQIADAWPLTGGGPMDWSVSPFARGGRPRRPVAAPGAEPAPGVGAVADRDRADRRRGRGDVERRPEGVACWSGGMPKKQAPRPSSTAVWRISSAAMPVSTRQ